MNIDNLIDQLISLPRNFRSRECVSAQKLLAESGYLESHEQVTEDAILGALRARPESLQDWMEWSDGKRTPTGWFVRQGGDDRYEVGHIRDFKDEYKSSFYDDAARACAAFVKREIESIRTEGDS